MRWLDHTVPNTGGRSIRELLVLAGGIALSTWELSREGGPDVGNAIVYVGATLLFALRFYLARAIGVGACIAAIAQQWPNLRYGAEQADLMTLGVFPLLAIFLLSSRDLSERFEGAPSNIRLLPNPWSHFTSAQTRTLRGSCYAAGALAGLLDHSLQISHLLSPPLWPRLMMIAAVLSIVILSLGRSIGLFCLWITGVIVALLTVPQLLAAEAAIAGESAGAEALLFTGGPHYVLPIVLFAIAAAAIATPFSARLLRQLLAD